MTSKRMLLFPPGGPWIPNPPAIVQTAAARNSAPTFPVNTTPGNLLLCLMTKRQAAAIAPNVETWTTIQTGQFQRTTTTDENGIGAFACVCTTPRTAYTFSTAFTHGVIHEISNSSLVGITSLLLSDQASGTVLDLGSLGSLDAFRLAFILAGNGADGVAETVTPGVWIRDWFADRDIDSGGTNSIGNTGGFPQGWYGHTTGAGIAVQARVDLSTAQKGGGIAVLLA